MQKTLHGFRTRDLTYIAFFAALIAVCSWISIPMTIPFTLQTFGVFTAVGVLGGARGTMAVLIYLLLGAAGLPVFANFTGGIGILLGMTGGYLVGFLFSALSMWAVEAAFGRSAAVRVISMFVGLMVCYAFGTVWFMAVYARESGPIGFFGALSLCVLPYLIPDLIKIGLAYALSGRLRRYALG